MLQELCKLIPNSSYGSLLLKDFEYVNQPMYISTFLRNHDPTLEVVASCSKAARPDRAIRIGAFKKARAFRYLAYDAEEHVDMIDRVRTFSSLPFRLYLWNDGRLSNDYNGGEDTTCFSTHQEHAPLRHHNMTPTPLGSECYINGVLVRGKCIKIKGVDRSNTDTLTPEMIKIAKEIITRLTPLPHEDAYISFISFIQREQRFSVAVNNSKPKKDSAGRTPFKKPDHVEEWTVTMPSPNTIILIDPTDTDAYEFRVQA